jgi:predicted nucleic acid-binding protein
MTLLVVDSSVIIKWFVDESLDAAALSIYADYQSGKYTFLAPDFVNAEVGNIVWKKHLRKELSTVEAQEVIDLFRLVSFQLTSTADLLEDAYQLAVQHQRTVYDMLYVALSRQKRCSFVTADEKLVNSVKTSLDNVLWLGNWS